MNPAMFLIGFLILIALWFLLSFIFRPLGRLVSRIYQDAMDEINIEEDKENKNNE